MKKIVNVTKKSMGHAAAATSAMPTLLIKDVRLSFRDKNGTTRRGTANVLLTGVRSFAEASKPTTTR